MIIDQQEPFRPMIMARILEIDQQLVTGRDETQAIAPDAAIGRISRLDSIQMQQMALAGKRRLQEERERLREALRRIDTGTYGRCLLCGEDISPERLEYQPDAVACVGCLQRLH